MKVANVIVTNLLILAAGIVFLLVFRRESVMEWVVVGSGVLFVATGLLNSLVLNRDVSKARKGKQVQSGSRRSLGWFCSVAAIILGTIMIVAPYLFVSLFVYIFAAVLFLGGVYHIYMLGRGLRPVVMPFWTYILPIVLLGGSVYMFFSAFNTPHESQNMVLMMAGIGLIIFAVTSFVEVVGYGVKRRAEKAPMATETPQTMDVVPTEESDMQE